VNVSDFRQISQPLKFVRYFLRRALSGSVTFALRGFGINVGYVFVDLLHIRFAQSSSHVQRLSLGSVARVRFRARPSACDTSATVQLAAS
jgi:hypothetical protein